MAINSSLHKVKEVKKEHFTKDAEIARIQEIVIDITNTLLKENSKLTAEVEAGLLNPSVLGVEIVKIIDKNGYEFYGRDELINKTFDYMFGYSVLQELVDDEDISDIDFSRYNYCTIKKNGVKSVVPLNFGDENQFRSFVKHVISRHGGIINENDPHCRISDYNKRLRINGCIFPRNVSGASLQIRKHPPTSPGIDTLISRNMLSTEVAEFICKLAKSSAKILITGHKASGKTTLLREIINKIDLLETVLLCESDTEIYPDNPNVIVQKIKKANDGGRTATLLDLVNDGLTMSLDTYVIGEMVGAEAWTLITAGLTGQRILATCHTNDATSTWQRLVTMLRQAHVDIPESSLLNMCHDAIDIVIHMESYKIMEILEVVGFDKSTHTVLTNQLYKFNISKIIGADQLQGTFGYLGVLKGRLSNEFKARGYYNG